MFSRSADSDFRRFRDSGDPTALARVFDRTVPELMRVARHLVATSVAGEREAGAEDLVQATYLTAIEASADHDGKSPVMPWLLGVLANHVRVARRKAMRRIDPESALRVLDVEDPADRAARSEVRGELEAAIRSLPEPYRPVLTLWFEHGLEPTEIGRALDRPAATVRAQVARGLERLRRSLPKEFAAAGVAVSASGVLASRGLAAVRTEVLQRCSALSSVGKSGAVAVAVASGVLMGTKTWLLGTGMVLLVLLLGTGWWFADGETDHGSGGGARPSGVAVVSSAEPVVEPVRESVADPLARTEVEGSVGEVPVPVRPGDDSPKLRFQIVRAVDESPVADMPVQLTRFAKADYMRPDRVGTTDADGLVTFVDPPRGMVLVQLPHVGTVWSVDADGPESKRLIVMPVPEGIVVRGRVTNAAGRAIPGARVRAYGSLLLGTDVVVSDDRGEFVLHDVASNIALEAHHDLHGRSLAVPVLGRPGQEVELDLQLAGLGGRVTGRVLLPSGEPAPGAQVVVVALDSKIADVSRPHERPSITIADDQGRFELRVRGVADRRTVAIAIPQDRDACAPAAISIPLDTGDDVVIDIELRAGAVVEGRLSSANELPTGTRVQIWAAEPEDPFGQAINLIGIRSVPIGEDGAFRIAGLPAGKSELHVHSGTGQTLGGTKLVLADGDTHAWNLDLDAGVGIRARVSPPAPDLEGVLPQWQAKVYRVLEAGREFAGYQSVGADGRLKFGSLDAASDYEIQVGVIGMDASTRGRIDCGVATFGPFRVGEQVHEFEVSPEQLPSASVAGRLVDVDGNPRGGVPVILSRQLAAANEPVSFAQVTTDDEGGFVFRPLVAGAWTMMHAPTGQPQRLASIPALVRGEVHQLGDVTLK